MRASYDMYHYLMNVNKLGLNCRDTVSVLKYVVLTLECELVEHFTRRYCKVL
jgi:hypothetical protein